MSESSFATKLQRRARVAVLLGGAALLAGCQLTSCGADPKRVECSKLRGADKIAVVGLASVVIETITEQTKMRKAVTFILRYEDGWMEHWRGPQASTVMLKFYEGTRYVGEFGLASTYLTTGFRYHDVPSKEIQALAGELGLPWPLQYEKGVR